MAIFVRTVGTGQFRGHETSIGPYRYNEGSMPHDVFDESGEIGQLGFQAEDVKGRSILLYSDRVELSDDFYGSITGFVNGFDYSDGFFDISGANRLNLLNTEAVVTPEVTTVDRYIRSILSAASIVADIAIAPDVPTTPITTPGYEGNLWILLKRFCALHQLDVSLIRNTVTVRPIRQRRISLQNISRESVNLRQEERSQKFQVAYYNYERKEDELAYPAGGWNPEVEVYSVEANETVVFNISVDAYLESVKQPIILDSVDKDYIGPDSVYSVSGSDGLPVPAALWEFFGGSMSFRLLDLGRVIEVTLKGPSFEQISPYVVAVSDGATQYSTLRIVGTGVFFDRQLATIPTGLTQAETPQEFGREIDNLFVSTFKEAYDAGVKARRHYSLPRHTFDATGRRLEVPDFREFDYLILDDDDSGILDQNVLAFVLPENAVLFTPSFEQFEATLPAGYLFSNFNDSYQSATFQDFEDSVLETVSQSFGNISGSRVRFSDAFYRVRSSNISEAEISVSADFDTLFGDFNNEFDSLQIFEFSNNMAGLQFQDYALVPLRTEIYLDVVFFTLDESELDGEAVLSFG